MQTLKIILASFLVTAAVIKGAPALADSAPAQNVSVVHTSDLDLSTAGGRAALERRLVIATYEVCGTASDADLAGKNQVRACRADVLAKARGETAQLANPAQGTIIVAAR